MLCEFAIGELAEVLKSHSLPYIPGNLIYISDMIIRKFDAHTYCNYPCLPALVTPGILSTRFERWSQGSVNHLDQCTCGSSHPSRWQLPFLGA